MKKVGGVRGVERNKIVGKIREVKKIEKVR